MSSNNWREAPTLALDWPRFLRAGMDRAAKIPRIEMTASNSISVNADERRTAFTKSLPAQNVILVGRQVGRVAIVEGRSTIIGRPLGTHGPNHDIAMITKII